MKNKIILLAICLFSFNILFAYENKNIENSNKFLISNFKKDKKKQSNNNSNLVSFNNNCVKSFIYYNNFQLESYISKIDLLLKKPNFEIALDDLNLLLLLDLDPKILSDLYEKKYTINISLNNFPEALICLEKKLEIDQKSLNLLEISKTYRLLGTLFYNYKEYSLSLKYFEKALEVNKKVNNPHNIATIYHQIGNCYLELGNSKTLIYFNKAFLVRQKINDLNGIAAVLSSYGLYYHSIKNYDLSNEYLNKALLICNHNNFKIIKVEIISLLAINAQKVNDYEKAIDLFSESIEYRIKYKDQLRTMIEYNFLGDIYLTIGDFKKAEKTFHKAKFISSEIKNKELLSNNTSLFFDFYQKIMKYQKSFLILKKQPNIDLEINEEKNLKIIDINEFEKINSLNINNKQESK